MERPHDLWADMVLEAPDEGVTRPAEMLGRALAAVVVGALLGALAGTRYDLVFGLPQHLSAIVQAAVFAAAWTCAGM
jgi:hypothetical protein